MDFFTHIVLGAAVGGLLAAKKLGNKALLWGAILALVPNIDVIISYFVDPITALYLYRGFTHSLVFFIVVSPFLALLLQKIYSHIEVPLSKWLRFSFWVLLSHALLDVFTVQGTGLFSPLWSKRFALSSLASVDLFFTIPLTIIVLFAIFVKQNRHKVIFSWFGIFIAVLYISFTFLNKLYVHSEFEKKLRAQDIRFSRIEVFPVLGSNFMWNCVAQDRDGFWMKYESNFSKHDFEIELFLRNDFYVFDFENDPRIHEIQQYSKGYFINQKLENGDVLIHDLRYGRTGLYAKAPFVYSYRIRNTHGIINYIQRIDSRLSVFISSK